ncbi:hypothetical protein MMC28_002052 [Mycoblastus sanguinarius]|nr:hypothetical protein [Mycoblastus sanguinarius]
MKNPNLPSSLEDAVISDLPPSSYYIPNFISEAEEAHILHYVHLSPFTTQLMLLMLVQINSAPLPTWKQLTHRRLQAHPSPLSSTNTLVDAPLPGWLFNPVIPRLLSLPMAPDTNDNIFSHSPHLAPNHCLVNEYLPGQGISAHEDGAAYFPMVATVSLGSYILLNVKPKNFGAGNGFGWRILQERRSLLIITGKVYLECLHGIDGVEVDEGLTREGIVNWNMLGEKDPFEAGRASREPRISLTFRDVIKVKKLGKAFGALGKR